MRLTLAFAINGNKSAGQWLKENAHWLLHVCDWDLFDSLGLLFIEFNVVESD